MKRSALLVAALALVAAACGGGGDDGLGVASLVGDGGTNVSDSAAGPEEAWKESLKLHFSQLEWECVSHRHSALARLAARSALASSLQVDESELEIGCGPGKPGRRIPLVFLRGKEVPVDLTLSHHGRLLAWAYLVPPVS